MTPQQLLTLKTFALADQEAAGYIANGQDNQLQDWFNSATTFVVWRSVLTAAMAREALVEGAAQLDALTAGKRDSLFRICDGDLATYKQAVRSAIDDLCGTQSVLKAAFAAAERRFATRAEKCLASGTGTTALPADLGWEGRISGLDASEIRTAQ